MAISIEDQTRTVAAGGTVYAGRGSALPSWRTAMAPGTWAEVPTSNTWASLDPSTLGIVPGGADFTARGMTLGLLSWTGGVWDDDTCTFWMPLGGGHTDYGGNEPYRICLDSEAPTWVMVRPPTGSTTYPGVTRDGKENTGYYELDGRLRAAHSYNNHCFVPGLGPVIARQAGVFYAPTPADQNFRAHWIDSSGEAHLIVDYKTALGDNPLIATADGACDYDPVRNAVWSRGHATTKLVRINLDDNTATILGAQNPYTYSGDALHYVPTADQLVSIVRGDPLVWRINLGNYVPVSPSVSGSYSAGLVANGTFSGAPSGFGSTWASDLGCIALYQQPSTHRTEISTLTPSDPEDLTQPWVRGVLPVDPSNTVTPPASPQDGLFGRFGYSSRFKGFYLIPNMTQVFFFASGAV